MAQARTTPLIFYNLWTWTTLISVSFTYFAIEWVRRWLAFIAFHKQVNEITSNMATLLPCYYSPWPSWTCLATNWAANNLTKVWNASSWSPPLLISPHNRTPSRYQGTCFWKNPFIPFASNFAVYTTPKASNTNNCWKWLSNSSMDLI